MAENSSLAMTASGTPGMTPPDLLPICAFSPAMNLATRPLSIFEVKYVPAWVPGAWWSKVGRKWRPRIDDLHNIPFDRVRKQMVRASFHLISCRSLPQVM